MPVIGFDRDDTVETGKQPGPVPLSIIESFVADSAWRTYAHGNQALVEEVEGLTGMKRVRHQTSVTDEQDEADEGLRKNRLRAIRALESDARRLVCVDNVNLSSLDGWEYYAPGKFMTHYPDRFLD